MRPPRLIVRPEILCAVLLCACQGSLDTWSAKSGIEGDGGPVGTEDGGGITEIGCSEVSCPDGQQCRAGRCETVDPCEDVVCNSSGEVCSGGVCVAGESDNDLDGFRARDDCNDLDAAVFPGATEACNAVDDDCDGDVDEDFDLDDDGATECGGGDPARVDCDDDDPMVFPGAPETCNGLDDDCDGSVDEEVLGAGVPCGSAVGECREGATVCREGALTCDGAVAPTPETCDGRDNDCDGAVDNGIAPRPCTGACGSGTERCEGGAMVCDAPTSGECVAGASEEMPCNCGVQRRTCSATCTWGGWSGCSGGACGAGATCCGGACLMDVNNCGDCGLVCPSGLRAACCTDAYGAPGCCPDGYPICGGDGYCYAY